ncbi:TVP38/TMEM64 family protein [Tropicimonas sp. S265A]|uniref:TVP38/TMEM64 family protein n=1 Tax=Tropicimonas sp. S265A TaxID=3415134 RepID=UPI003C7CEB2D
MSIMEEKPRAHPKTRLPKWVPLAAIGLVAAIGAFTLKDTLSFEALAANREALLAFRDANFIATIAVYLALYIAIVSFSLPGATIATLTGGFLFGLATGTVVTVFAATIGATVIFLAARWGLGEKLAAKMDASEGKIKQLKQGLAENEISVLFLMRLVPAIPFFVANLLPALVGVKLRNFIITTFFGIIPGTAVYTWVGAGLGEVFARGETPNLGIIFEPHILGPILGLSALALLPILLKKFRKTESA